MIMILNTQKILRNPLKTITTNKQVQQSYEIKGQYTKINSFLHSLNKQTKNEINNSMHQKE